MAARLIVGLGNPGPEYDGTRHNIGFEVIDRLSADLRIPLDRDRDHALYGAGSWRGRKMVLARPMTFMNRSGQAVLRLMNRFGLERSDVLVVLDDLNLPLGTVRLRAGGSDGGHNGMEDVVRRVGGSNIARLRLGIGSDFRRGGQVDYVLAPFEAEELDAVEGAVAAAVAAVKLFVHQGIQRAMSETNRKDGDAMSPTPRAGADE